MQTQPSHLASQIRKAFRKQMTQDQADAMHRYLLSGRAPLAYSMSLSEMQVMVHGKAGKRYNYKPEMECDEFRKHRLAFQDGGPIYRVPQYTDSSGWHVKRHAKTGWAIYGYASHDHFCSGPKFFALHKAHGAVAGFGGRKNTIRATSNAAMKDFLASHGHALGFYDPQDN